MNLEENKSIMDVFLDQENLNKRATAIPTINRSFQATAYGFSKSGAEPIKGDKMRPVTTFGIA